MAISVYDSAQKWGNEVGDIGVALYGKCRQSKGLDVRPIEKVYGKRFKEYAQWKSSPEYSRDIFGV